MKGPSGTPRPWFDVKADFPIFAPVATARRLVYLDSASTAQKPLQVIEAVRLFTSHENAKVHRNVHSLGERATMAFELARVKAQRLLGAAEAREVLFVRSSTEALNLVAESYGRLKIQEGDEIVLTALEHHSNILPWQGLRASRGAVLRVAPLTESGDVDLDQLARLLSHRTRIVAVAHVSSAVGTVLPVRRIAEIAHSAGAVLVVDGAMAAPRLPVNVREMGCDFYATSGHKLYGPTGVGVLYGRAELLEEMPPYQVGGDMVRSVRFDHSELLPIPQKFEAGTPNIEGAIGLGAAIDYLRALGIEEVAAHESHLLDEAIARLSSIERIRILGRPLLRAGSIAFEVEGVHPHDLATILDQEGVAIRAGHLCAQPLLESMGVSTAVRLSVGVYNTSEDIEALGQGVERAIRIFG